MLFALTCAVLSATSTASAVEGEPQRLQSSVPDVHKAAYAELLDFQGFRPLSKLIDETKFSNYSTVRHEDGVVFRIEDATSCNGDECLTIIVHPDGPKLVVDLMFAAGPFLGRSDLLGRDVLGARYSSSTFSGAKSRTNVLDTAGGLIVVPEPPKK